MYCSIDDAWGSDFNKDSKYSDSDKTEEFKQREYTLTESSDDSANKSEKQAYTQYMKLRERFGDGESEDKVCIAVNTHINKCATCRARYLASIERPSILPSMNTIMEKIHNNSDTITIMLICVMILLIIKLFRS